MSRKIGLILECGAGGPDQLVLECLIKRLSPATTVLSRPQGSKPAVYLNAADVATKLVESDHCDLVLIVWDQKPLWKDEEKNITAKNCKDERLLMLASLQNLPSTIMSRVKLLCISAELETWLLADDAAMRNFFSTKAHPCKWKGIKYDPNLDAKAALITLSTKIRGRKYSEFTEAIRIARMIENTRKLRKIASFARLSSLITGNPKADFVQDSTVCNDLAHQPTRTGR